MKIYIDDDTIRWGKECCTYTYFSYLNNKLVFGEYYTRNKIEIGLPRKHEIYVNNKLRFKDGITASRLLQEKRRLEKQKKEIYEKIEKLRKQLK